MAEEVKMYQLEDFEPFVGSEFILSKEGVDQTLPIKLIEAAHSNHEAPEGMRRGFSLLFQLPPNLPLEQDIFTITHEEFGSADLFLVPIQPNEDGSLMESIFN